MTGTVRVWTDEKKATIRRMWCDERMSASEIGAAFGVTRNTICGVVNRMGLDDFRGAVPPEQVAAVKEARRLARVHQQNLRNERSRQRLALAKPKREAIEYSTPKPTEPPPGGFACVALADRRKDQCAWIIGEPVNGMQCGHQVIPGKSWCAHHHSIVYDRTPHRPFAPLARVLTLAGGVAI